MHCSCQRSDANARFGRPKSLCGQGVQRTCKSPPPCPNPGACAYLSQRNSASSMLCVVRMIARPGLAALITSHSTRREAGSRPWVCWEMEGGVGEDRGVKGGGGRKRHADLYKGAIHHTCLRTCCPTHFTTFISGQHDSRRRSTHCPSEQ
jgi:hypothetical protein